MSGGDEETESRVDNLFREVDDHFGDLEREYHQARQELADADVGRRDQAVDPVEATAERYELMSEVASLKGALERTAEQLDDRDQLLAELGERMGEFEAQIAAGEAAAAAERQLGHDLAEERRETSRLNALLEARVAERQELADVAHRLQGEKEHMQELLTTALARFEQVDGSRSELVEKLTQFEAARESEVLEFESRGGQLADAKSEIKRLSDQVDELSAARDNAVKGSDKFEGLVERRDNEIGYLKRRIDVLAADSERVDALDEELRSLDRDNTLLKRRVAELESELQSQNAEVVASAKAVEALAERSSERDEFAAKVDQLQQKLDQAESPTLREHASPVAESSTAVSEIQRLTERVKEMGARRTDEAPADEPASVKVEVAEALEVAGAVPVVEVPDELAVTPVAAREPEAAALVEEVVDAPPVEPDPEAAPAVDVEPDPDPEAAPAVDVEPDPEPEAATADVVEPDPEPEAATADVVEPDPDPEAAPAVDVEPEPEPEVAAAAPAAADAVAPTFDMGSDGSDAAQAHRGGAVGRRRIVLPADLEPNTQPAVEFLLNQAGVTAIVDARSCCGRIGLRPSELFERIALLRDRYDVPVEVVVTPVSTPIGGAPELVAVGVHQVTGADTVADRVRSLCMGFPADQPLIVIAGDDYVRRAAIGEEANVVDPVAALGPAQS